MTNITEVARSMSRTINTGNYESIQIFCSMKAEVGEGEDPSEVSVTLHEMCKAEIMRDAKEIKEKIKK